MKLKLEDLELEQFITRAFSFPEKFRTEKGDHEVSVSFNWNKQEIRFLIYTNKEVFAYGHQKEYIYLIIKKQLEIDLLKKQVEEFQLKL